MPRILSISSSRADVGILLPVWRALSASAGCELHVLLTGMHAPSTSKIAVPPGVRVHRGGADLGGAAPENAAAAMASILSHAGRVFAEVRPDAVLVIGDRLDMIPAALAAVPFNLPLAHLHGGEITEGALDDRLRHAISKLAHLHLVSTPAARHRLLAMGEEEWRIHVTGAPGLDSLCAAPTLTRRAFLEAVGFDGEPSNGCLRLVTVHPETNADDPLAPLRAVLAALDARPGSTLFTAPNSDPGGSVMREMIATFVAARGWARYRETLGPELYPNALRHADVMVGNSSSGLIEAALFGLVVINVGDRQKGRESGPNVIHVRATAEAVSGALAALGAKPARINAESLYGDGMSGPRVAATLLGALASPELRRKRVGAVQ
jgi:UDP-hydrolysing UDP-N-acetyl-D-glucosamine 2-epimerase